MKKSNENKIFKCYPTLFPNGRKVSPNESLICFGLEVDDGWFNLIDDLCKNILEIDNNKDTIVVQIKEKFGGLRFYICGGNEEIHALIHLAENESYNICEVCGKEGKLRDNIGWYKTLCDKHYNKKLESIKSQELKRKGEAMSSPNLVEQVDAPDTHEPVPVKCKRRPGT